MATRLRHIAIIVPDPEKAATFFEQAFGMTRAGTARRGIYMSDGVMNVALLRTEGSEKPGLYHFGMWVDDLDEADKAVTQAGGTYLAGRPTSPNSFYEAKYRDPNGVVFDLTHHGWAGAVKEVVAKPGGAACLSRRNASLSSAPGRSACALRSRWRSRMFRSR